MRRGAYAFHLAIWTSPQFDWTPGATVRA
jgi:hypothetical protein